MGSDLLVRDARSVWHPFTQVELADPPLPVVAARGTRLILEDGNELIDGISSWWCNTHGHGHPELVRAAASQMETLDHVIFAGFTHEPAVSLAEELVAVLPHRFDKVFFTDNGSSAVEVALKMSVQYWHNQGQRRTRIVALDHSYHGDTFGAMATGARGIFAAPFEDMLFGVDRLSTEGTEEDLARCRELCASGQVAAFIFEPKVQGAGGMRVYPSAVLDSYLDLFRAHGVVCIADEVMTGFGRTGPLFACAEMRNPPDVICLSKGLTGGTLPLAVTACRNEIFEAFRSREHSRTFFHGHTYTANPVACAVARASLKLTLAAACEARRAEIQRRHTAFLERLTEFSHITEPRVAGTIVAFTVQDPKSQGYTSSVAQRALRFFRQRGVLLRPLGNVVYFMPPYCISDAELEVVYDAIVDFCRFETEG
jgi:adenosylmethionine-8-amino-7-oxononanoate aminotransferase